MGTGARISDVEDHLQAGLLKAVPEGGESVGEFAQFAVVEFRENEPFVETIYETFDVGVDTRTGVDDNDYQPPSRFTGKIDKLTVKLVPLNAAQEKLLQQKAQDTKNKAQ